MASSIDFVQYIVDQCSGAGDIAAKKMFGDYGIYCDGKTTNRTLTFPESIPLSN